MVHKRKIHQLDFTKKCFALQKNLSKGQRVNDEDKILYKPHVWQRTIIQNIQSIFKTQQ